MDFLYQGLSGFDGTMNGNDQETRTLPKEIDMNIVMNKMKSKLLNQNLVSGYALYYNITYSDYAFNKITIDELSNEIAKGSSISPLSSSDMSICFQLYNNNAMIRSSSNFFKSILFKNDFDVSIETLGGTKMAQVQDDIKTTVINNFWMPTLNQHYDWIKMFGICPFYFEPIGIKVGGRLKIHYVPKIPHPDSGIIYTYINTNGKQSYFWKWMNCTQHTVLQINSSSLTFLQNQRPLVKKSRYMFFDVKYPPLMTGKLTSDIASLINDHLFLEKAISQTVQSVESMINPPYFIEFNGGIKNLGLTSESNDNNKEFKDNLDLIKLQVDLLKSKIRSPTSQIDSYSELMGQEFTTSTDTMINKIEQIRLNRMDYTNNNNSSSYRQHYDSANTLGGLNSSFNINPNSSLNNELLLNSIYNTDIDNNSVNSMFVHNDDSKLLERYKVYAMNNPNSQIAHILKKIERDKMVSKKIDLNIIKLDPFDKLVSNTNNIKMPDYNIPDLQNRFNVIVNSICDFPMTLNFLNQKSTSSSSHSLSLLIFKEKLIQSSRSYESFIKQLWTLSYSLYLGSFTKKLKQDTVHTYTNDIIKLINNISVTLTRTPFLGINEYYSLFKMGILTTFQFYDSICECYGLEKRNLSEKDLQIIESHLKLINSKSSDPMDLDFSDSESRTQSQDYSHKNVNLQTENEPNQKITNDIITDTLKKQTKRLNIF